MIAQQQSGRAAEYHAPGDALPFTGGYLITGDYEVGDFGGFAADPADANYKIGTVSITTVPANADIVAAFVYGEAILSNTVPVLDPVTKYPTTDPPTLIAGPTGTWEDRFFDPRLKFGVGSTLELVPFGTATSRSLDPLVPAPGDPVVPYSGLATCAATPPAAGETRKLTTFRADVLRFLPMEMTAGTPTEPSIPVTGKRLVNATQLTELGLGALTIRVPQHTTGATLVVVYRDPLMPLRKIVVYDGVHVQPTDGLVTTQTLRGFYHADPLSLGAKVTHIMGRGPNANTGALSF
ncbi:MAG TPA: hypothetical protein VFZ31_06660, partial [Vicinamibacterales bacterium]